MVTALVVVGALATVALLELLTRLGVWVLNRLVKDSETDFS